MWKTSLLHNLQIFCLEGKYKNGFNLEHNKRLKKVNLNITILPWPVFKNRCRYLFGYRASTVWMLSPSNFLHSTRPHCPLTFTKEEKQCSRFVTFWCKSGSEDLYLWLTDPDLAPDSALFVSDLQYANKKTILKSQKAVEILLFFCSWWKDPDPYLWLTDPDPGGPKTWNIEKRTLAVVWLNNHYLF